jgi:hypothetical protein
VRPKIPPDSITEQPKVKEFCLGAAMKKGMNIVNLLTDPSAIRLDFIRPRPLRSSWL